MVRVRVRVRIRHNLTLIWGLLVLRFTLLYLYPLCSTCVGLYWVTHFIGSYILSGHFIVPLSSPLWSNVKNSFVESLSSSMNSFFVPESYPSHFSPTKG